jgi:hypothetical protein
VKISSAGSREQVGEAGQERARARQVELEGAAREDAADDRVDDVVDGQEARAGEGDRGLAVADLQVEHRGLHGVGAHDSDVDAAGPQLLCGGEGEGADGVLGGRVEADAGDRREGGERGDVDDVALAALQHVAGGGVGAEDDALGVDVDVAVDGLGVEVADVAGEQVAGDIN